MTALEFHVTGTPVPQGSKRWVGTRMIESAAATLKPWRQAVSTCALVAARQQGWVKGDGPVRLTVTFEFLKPPSAPKKRRYPDRRPDIDKCVRAILDGITDSNSVWGDDARVVSLFASKAYAADGRQPGAWIAVETLPIARDAA